MKSQKGIQPPAGEDDLKRAFIPAWLDDAGLSTLAFRIYCRVLRRGRLWDSKTNLEREFGVSNRKLAAAFEELKSRKLITEQARQGQASFYEPSAIQHHHLVPVSTGSEPDPVPDSTTPQCQTAPPPSAIQHHHLVLSSTTKDTPIKETPIKDTPTKVSSSPDAAMVEAIYQAYPRKVAKPAGLKAIRAAMKSQPSERLLERTRAYAAAIGWKERNYIPHPSTWFNQARYDDDPREWENPKSPNQTAVAKSVDTGHRKAGAIINITKHQ